jgi:uncharacterized membrane protein (DUF441 family)
MNSTLKEVLVIMFTSKKWLAVISSLVVGLLAKLGLNLSTEDILLLLAPFVAYILAQGRADQGKSAAQIAADATPKDTNNGSDPTV